MEPSLKVLLSSVPWSAALPHHLFPGSGVPGLLPVGQSQQLASPALWLPDVSCLRHPKDL